jgi:hypothetical protein
LVLFSLAAVITTVVGLRLLAVAARTRQIPELAAGAVMLLELLSAAGWAAAKTTASGQLLSTAAGAASAAVLGLFVVYTFVPQSRLARFVLSFLLAGALACVLVPSLSAGWGSETFYRQYGWGASLARVFGYAWAAIAAARSRDALRRRARLGLSHPLTATRVGFWAIAAACACVSYAIPLLDLVTGMTPAGTISPISAGIAIAVSSLIWLAFYPPKIYVTWALRRAGQA